MNGKTTHRKNLGHALLVLVAAVVPSLASPIVHARESGDRPNVIVFFLDDSGYGDYAHNGNPTIRTPNISKLAHDGINFTQFYVTSPACSASRYSLLTGRYPGRSGLGSMGYRTRCAAASPPPRNHHCGGTEDSRLPNRHLWQMASWKPQRQESVIGRHIASGARI